MAFAAFAFQSTDHCVRIDLPFGRQLGTIEAGKLADLVVLSDDYFTVPDEKLKKIRSVLTMVSGSIVHDTKALE